MLQLTLLGVGWAVQRLPNGGVQLGFQDRESGISIAVPLDADAARDMGQKLRSSAIVVASGIPEANGHGG